MGTKARASHLTRRDFVTRVGAIGAGLAAGAAGSGITSRAAGAAIDLRGTGSVAVHHAGGALGEAYRKAFFEPFEAATGIKVIPVPGTTPAKLRAGILAGAPGLDVFAISGGNLGALIKEGLLEPIDYRWFDPADKAAFLVPAQEYATPEIFFSLVLAYNPRKFGGNPPKTWAHFWDTGRYPGPRALATGSWGTGSATFEVALLADGVPPDRLYPLDLDRAFRSLERIRPALLKFWSSGAEPVQLLIDGQVAATSAYNGRVYDLQSKGAKVGMSWEQGILHYGYWIVPKGAKNKENAMKFLAFFARPEPEARFCEVMTYTPPNARAFEHISPERAAILPTAPAQRARQVLANYDWWNSEAARGKTNEQLALELWERWVTGNR